MATLIGGLEEVFEIELPYWFILEHGSVNALIEFFEQPADQRAALLARRVEAFEAEVETPSEERSPPRPTPARALGNVLLQFAGLLLRPGLAIVSLLPAVWISVQIVQGFGFGAAFAMAPLLLFGTSVLAWLPRARQVAHRWPPQAGFLRNRYALFLPLADDPQSVQRHGVFPGPV